jgi:hypothetical protein
MEKEIAMNAHIHIGDELQATPMSEADRCDLAVLRNTTDRYLHVYPGELVAVIGERLIEHGLDGGEVVRRAFEIVKQQGLSEDDLIFVTIPPPAESSLNLWR